MINSTANEIPKAIVARFKMIELYLKHLYFLLVLLSPFRSRTSACMYSAYMLACTYTQLEILCL